MNYIELINHFWQLADINGYTSAESNVYFRLLDICNRLGWPRTFQLTNVRLAVLTGLNERTIIAARSRLEECGLIRFTKGEHNRVAPTYSLPEKIDNQWTFPTDNTTENTVKNTAKNDTYNKTKLNKTKSSSSSTREEEEIYAFSKLAEDVMTNCPIWLQQMADRLRVTQQKICEMINGEFRQHFLADAHAPHQSLRDFQSHFNRWATIQQNKPKQTTKRQEDYTPASDKYARRRGYEPSFSDNPADWAL